jgi:cyclopropane fatty-acyl-phospholipid synthase-like methyltransferase
LTRERPNFEDAYRTNSNVFGFEYSDGLAACVSKYAALPCKVLDVGCGQGRNAIWLASQGYDVVAIDSSHAAIESVRSRARLSNVRIDARVGDISTCDIETAEFGLIVVITTLNHLKNEVIPRTCGKLCNALSCNGILYCVSFTTDDPGFKKTSQDVSEWAYLVKHYFEPGELRGLFRGLKILEYTEYVKVDDSHGRQHLHGKAKLVGENARNNMGSFKLDL